MAIAKAGKAGKIYQKSLVCAIVKNASTIVTHTKTKVFSFDRLTRALKKQRPAAKGKINIKIKFSLVTK